MLALFGLSSTFGWALGLWKHNSYGRQAVVDPRLVGLLAESIPVAGFAR